MGQLRGAEIPEAEMCFCAAVVDDKQGGTSAATHFHFYLVCRPDASLISQAEGGELFHRSRAFLCFLNINWKAYIVIEPTPDLAIVGSVRRAGRAFHNVAIAGAEFGLFNHCLARPEILLF